MDLYSVHDIRALLSRHGFHFSKSLGQNFLTERRVCEQIAEFSGIDQACGVLEIGPGIGALTLELSRISEKVVSVEIDRKLLPILDETLTALDNVKVISADIMKTDLAELCASEFGYLRPVVCANLPYYITTPVLSRLIDSGVFTDIIVMVQKEVAERICAASGTGAYGAFSVYVQFHTKAELLFHVPASCFVPQPKVNSAVVRLSRRENPPAEVLDKALFFRVVRAAFAQRRKLLSNGLSAVFAPKMDKSAFSALFEKLGFPETIRGETLSIADFAKITNALSDIFNK